MKKQLREWAEKFAPCYSNKPYQRGYSAGIIDAKCTVLEMLNQAELREVADLNIYKVFKKDGVQMIKVLGFFLEGDDGWKRVEFVGLEMSLAEYQQGMIEDDDFYWNIETTTEQHITNFHSIFEAYEALKKYEAKPLSISEVDENTPEGVYY